MCSTCSSCWGEDQQGSREAVVGELLLLLLPPLLPVFNIKQATARLRKKKKNTKRIRGVRCLPCRTYYFLLLLWSYFPPLPLLLALLEQISLGKKNEDSRHNSFSKGIKKTEEEARTTKISLQFFIVSLWEPLDAGRNWKEKQSGRKISPIVSSSSGKLFLESAHIFLPSFLGVFPWQQKMNQNLSYIP